MSIFGASLWSGSFTLKDIKSINPDHIGVFVLYRNGECIHIGSGNICGILSYLHKEGKQLLWYKPPTHYVYEIIDGIPVKREKELIKKFKPKTITIVE